jgi:hypothetical protein
MKYEIEKNYNKYWVSKTIPNTPDYPEYYNCDYVFPNITVIIGKVNSLKDAKKLIKNEKERA